MKTFELPIDQINEDFNRYSGASTGFEARLSPTPHDLAPEDLHASQARHATIRSFQQKALDLFRASLDGDADPRIADGILGDVLPGLGADYHRRLDESAWQPPIFFRTDEARLGQLTEIQCSGSGWDLTQAIHELYASRPEQFGRPRYFEKSIAERFAESSRSHMKARPVVHHLVDNASRPHGARYFIQKTRQYGVRYLGYDRDVNAASCNLLRSHDFFSIVFHNFFQDRLERCRQGEFFFDLPPIALFDCKLILAWPFWSVTREHFSDAERALFPHTAVVGKDGMEDEHGSLLDIDSFQRLPSSRRDYFLKYGGTDVSLNWGSRAVHSMKSLSRPKCAEVMSRAVEDAARGRPWILQKAVFVKEDVPQPSGASFRAHAKWSNFYGPEGLMGQLVMHRNAHKVHGNAETVISIAF